MHRSTSIVLAAVMAAGAAVAALAPAQAAPVRAAPALEQPATGKGIEEVRHRRQWNRGYDRHWRRDYRKRWRHRRFSRYPRFYFGYPYYVPPRSYFYYRKPLRRHRRW